MESACLGRYDGPRGRGVVYRARLTPNAGVGKPSSYAADGTAGAVLCQSIWTTRGNRVRSMRRQAEHNLLLGGAHKAGFRFQSQRHRQGSDRVFEAGLRRRLVRVVRANWPDEAGRGVELQRPAVVPNPSAERLSRERHACLSELELLAGAGFELLAGLQA